MRRMPLGFVVMAAVIALPAFAADKKCSLQQLGQLPITMSGTQPLITGTINGTQMEFLVDSGAFFSMLSSETAAKLNLRVGPLPQGFIVAGTGGTARAGVAKTKEFSLVGLLGGRVYKDIEFIVGGNAFARNIDGIIGQNVIGRADIEYDLANGFIRLFVAKDCKGAAMVYWAKNAGVGAVEIDDTTRSNPHLIGGAKINGQKIRVLFDTGASSSILNGRAAVRLGFKPENDDVAAGGVSFGIGTNTTENYLVRFDSLDLGGEVIKNARLRVGNMSSAIAADMLLGADFFLSHRVYVSLSQNMIYFTYNGGPVFDLRSNSRSGNTQAATPNSSGAAELSTTGSPVDSAADSNAKIQTAAIDAAALRRRGTASVGRNDFQAAIADFDRAIKLDSNDAENYYERGNAYYQTRQAKLAFSDFDQALKLKPDHIAALLGRGSMRLVTNDEAAARADFAEAIRLDPQEGQTQLRVAQIYSSFQRHGEAIATLTKWIDANPRDDRLPGALNERCWSRAILGKELNLALEDCNLAIKRGTRNSQVLNSRAFTYLRLGDYDKSIADYKAVLKLQPKQAISMYGLGVAEIKKGLKAEGEKDIQAAVAIAPNIAQFYKWLGLAP